MSLLSSIILPRLEKELIALEPLAAQFLLNQFKEAGIEFMAWVESKENTMQADSKPNDVLK